MGFSVTQMIVLSFLKISASDEVAKQVDKKVTNHVVKIVRLLTLKFRCILTYFKIILKNL